jgi:hypothetical protein
MDRACVEECPVAVITSSGHDVREGLCDPGLFERLLLLIASLGGGVYLETAKTLESLGTQR